jgi:hypothetical protein
MSKLTGLLVTEMFETATQIKLYERWYYELNERDFRRFRALAPGNPTLSQAVEESFDFQRQNSKYFYIPVDLVQQARLESQDVEASDEPAEDDPGKDLPGR